MGSKSAACCCTLFVCATSYAGIMRHDIAVQDYRDFGENLGKYAVGTQQIPVYKTNVVVTAGIEYQYSPGKAGSSLTLSDSHSRREYGGLSDNRYRMQVGIGGNITDRWSLEVKARNSVGGNLRTDYSGSAGIHYQF